MTSVAVTGIGELSTQDPSLGPSSGLLRDAALVMAAITRRTPAASTASVHGGVLPWWQHGSSVTYSVAPRADLPVGTVTSSTGTVLPSDRLSRSSVRAVSAWFRDRSM